MKTLLIGGVAALAAISFAPLANADPTAGHGTQVHTQTPPMLCEIGSDNADPGIGPSVVCQRGQGFVGSSPDNDQAVILASGKFSYRSANIGVGGRSDALPTLVPGQTYHFQGWTVVASGDGTRFTNDGTGHGMTVNSDTTVRPF
jgi:hypothetical protein